MRHTLLMAKRNGRALPHYRLFTAEWCRAKGVTQASVAAEAGITEGHLSAMSSGLRGVSIPTLFKVAQALNITVGQLFRPPGPPELLERVQGLDEAGKRILARHLDAIEPEHRSR